MPTGHERRCEGVFRQFSPVLNSQCPSPPLPLFIANSPCPPPTAFSSAFHSLPQTTTFPSIRPFRDANYPSDPGEDRSSLVYTLNADNMWEVNWDYTRTVRSTAQSSSPLQFATYVPTDHWNPHQRTHNGGGNTHPLQPPLQFQPQITPVPPGSADRLNRPPHNEPPTLNVPRHSTRTLVDPSAAKLSDHHDDLSYGSTPTAAATKREGRRLQGSMSSDTGEKNFKCEACGSSYSRKAELDRHQGTAKKHNGTGKFACGCCGVWFTRSDARLRHERKCAMGEGSRRSSSSSESGRAKGKERDTAVDIDEYEEED